MSQRSLENFFKSKTSVSKHAHKKMVNKKGISTVIFPKETMKPDNNLDHTIVLSSDDEFVSSDDKRSNAILSPKLDIQDTSNSSQSTLIYTPKTPQTPRSVSSVCSVSGSPSDRKKFYSPSKKRLVTKLSPVKRNLNQEFCAQSPKKYKCDEDFTKACEGLCDKTIFLLRTINEYLSELALNKLLDEQSRLILYKTFQVLKPGIGLVCRMYWRRDCWCGKEKLKSVMTEQDKKNLDTPRLELMLQTLLANGFIETSENKNLSLEEYITMLKQIDLKQICKELKRKVKTKEEAIHFLKNYSESKGSISNWLENTKKNNADRVLNMMKQKAGACYRLSGAARLALDKLYVLMYLGIDYTLIRDKKLEFTLINDKANVEVYPIRTDMVTDNASVIFSSENEFESYFQSTKFYDKFLNLTSDTAEMNGEKKCSMVMDAYKRYNSISEEDMRRYKALPPWLRRFTAANIYIKILEDGINELKRSKKKENWITAVQILDMLISQRAFRQHKRWNWYEEKAKIFHKHLCDHEQAAKTLMEAFESDMSDDSKDHLRPRATMLADQLNAALTDDSRRQLQQFACQEDILEKNIPCQHVYAHYEENKRGKQKFRTQTGDGEWLWEDAETYCCRYYIENQSFTNAEHWEGRIVTTIFFLLFWDIIYAKLPGVRGLFLTKYQRFPLDMYHDDFYRNRETLIEDRLREIENSQVSQLLKEMETIWNTRHEAELSGIVRGVGWESVASTARCLRPVGLAALCARLAANYKYSHTGFPDLTVWNVFTNQIKFVEVKTDSDRPSMKQKQWMRYLRERGVHTEFCYVGVNTTRAKSRGRPT